jgi:hypothetical protein
VLTSEACVTSKLVVQAPLAAEVTNELGSGDDSEVVVDSRQGNTSDLWGSDEIVCLDESMGTRENSELGRYEVYIVSPQLREGLGLALEFGTDGFNSKRIFSNKIQESKGISKVTRHYREKNECSRLGLLKIQVIIMVNIAL